MSSVTSASRRWLGRLRAATITVGALLSLLFGAGSASGAPVSGTTASLEDRAVWIWDLSASDGGDPAAIAEQAHAAGVGSVFVKAADGATPMPQFTAGLVSALRDDGLYVCAWVYAYGDHPALEARVALDAIGDGAQCLIIDAEVQYQGRYWAAQTYLRDIRAQVGEAFPMALASFPYVSDHPTFPYSVFLGPGGAQFDLPQMYWRSIGTSIDSVFAQTFVYNRIYGRTIIPVGQLFGAPTPSQIVRFRDLTVAYGAPGISWWDWAWTSQMHLWDSVSALLNTPSHFDGPDLLWPVLREGYRGDDVLWLQEHLARDFPAQRITGLFAGQTLADLDAFQSQHGLAVTGETDGPTWQALLELAPVTVDWPAPR